MSNTQNFGQTKDSTESPSELKYTKECLKEGRDEQKRLCHKMAQPEIPHLNCTAAKIGFRDTEYHVTYSSPSTSE
jgi:hypothetical protein